MERRRPSSPDACTAGDYFRNAARITERKPHFDAAYAARHMVSHAHTTDLTNVGWSSGLLGGGRRAIVDFVRHSYLGLDNHPLIIAGAIEANEALRSLHRSGARTQFGFDLLGELEETLSEMFCARVLAFSSGMLADLIAIPILASGQLTGGRKPVVVLDHSARVSPAYHRTVVVDQTRVETIAHNDIDTLERLCRENPLIAYICDGVYPIGENAPVKELRRLQDRYGLFLYIDDSDGLSICGYQGEGFARSRFSHVLGERTIIAASLGKGFGASGGILMLGAAEHDPMFRPHSISCASSVAPNLAAIGAALASCKIHLSLELGQRQARLAQRVELFDRLVVTAEQGNLLPIRTIAIRSQADAITIARRLLDLGFYTSATFLPAQQEKVGLRLCITADHEVRDIRGLCDSILKTVADTTGKPYPLR
ncbi:8-amino-7-oxononanoate synthase [Bradyrhizobium sp. USDA 4341]